MELREEPDKFYYFICCFIVPFLTDGHLIVKKRNNKQKHKAMVRKEVGGREGEKRKTNKESSVLKRF